MPVEQMPRAEVQSRNFLRRTLAAVGVVAALATGVTACDSEDTTFAGNPSGDMVAFLGDSLINVARQNIHESFDSGYLTNIQGLNGRRIDQTHDAQMNQIWGPGGTASAPEGTTKALVVNAGTNDIMQSYNWRPGYDQLKNLFQFYDCVVITTVSTLPEISYHRTPMANAINDQIRADVATHPNWHIVDWAAQAGQPFMITMDMVHETSNFTEGWPQEIQSGAEWLAESYRDAIENDCGIAPAEDPNATTTTVEDTTTTSTTDTTIEDPTTTSTTEDPTTTSTTIEDTSTTVSTEPSQA